MALKKITSFTLVASLLLTASTGLAQETTQSDETAEVQEVGRTYDKETHGDWIVRCVRTEDGKDPCQLYQLLLDDNGNSVAEISMLKLAEGQPAEAGATIAVPLGTLLTEQLSLGLESGQSRKYPFSWCTTAGCFARIGLSAEEVAGYKRGSKAVMTIVPVAAQETKVTLNVSLAGFTAGYKSISDIQAANK